MPGPTVLLPAEIPVERPADFAMGRWAGPLLVTRRKTVEAIAPSWALAPLPGVFWPTTIRGPSSRDGCGH
jgi:hypothetical protein